MAQDMLHEEFMLKSQTNGTTLISTSLDMGVSVLNVRDLNIMTKFYSAYADLEIIKKSLDTVILGYNDRQIIKLQRSTEEFAPENSAGLYHNAIVFSSRGQLSRAVRKILEEVPHYYAGTADHLVSEAFYFTDPEGNGLELYFDKDKSSWEWQDGKIKMSSIYIDPVAYIEQYASVYESTEKHVGHVHLKVGNTQEAKTFYVEILGFDITAELGSALFISVAGYHHHIGLNTWESNGAGIRNPSLGLHSFELILNSNKDIERLKLRLKEHDITFREVSSTLLLSDPWNNLLVISTKK